MLSMFHQFHYLYYLSVLSNAWNQNHSKGSLPNVQGVFNCYLLQLCPLSQPAVLCPSTRPSAYVFTSLKMASLAGIFRISGSLAKDHVDCFTSGHHHHESVVSVFLNIFNCVYAILKHCYLFYHLSIPCPSLLSFGMQKSFFLQHDFKARCRN